MALTDALGSRDLITFCTELSRIASAEIDRQLKACGLNRTQWRLLELLGRRDGQTHSELARALSIARPPLGRTVDRLEHAGLVLRRVDDDDRRFKRVFLTPDAAPLLAQIHDVRKQLSEVALEGMAADARSGLLELLEAVHTNLDRRLQEPF